MVVTITGVFLTQCDKETETPAANVTGKITLDGGTVANGAIVVISSAPNAATVIAKTVTDELGMYSFLGIDNGTYYISARYEPGNNNNLKSTGTVILTGIEVEVEVSGDQVADITLAGTGSASPPCAHGRDGITGCIGGTFGVDLNPADTVDAYCQDGTLNADWPNESLESFDLWGDQSATSYMKQSSIVGSTGVATFESTFVEAYGTGYLAKGNFTFMGVTKAVDMYFSYIEGYQGTDRGGNNVQYSSFYGTFKFAALADFGVSSGHVGNADINVSLAVQFNKAL